MEAERLIFYRCRFFILFIFLSKSSQLKSFYWQPPKARSSAARWTQALDVLTFLKLWELQYLAEWLRLNSSTVRYVHVHKQCEDIESTCNECRMSQLCLRRYYPCQTHLQSVRMDWIHSCIRKRQNRSVHTSMQAFRTLLRGYCYICRVMWHCRREILCSCNRQYTLYQVLPSCISNWNTTYNAQFITISICKLVLNKKSATPLTASSI